MGIDSVSLSIDMLNRLMEQAFEQQTETTQALLRIQTEQTLQQVRDETVGRIVDTLA